MTRNLRLLALVLAITAVGVVLPGTARAAPPANDNFADATVIDPATTSFTETVDVTEATIEPGEQQFCSLSSRTVWWTITPAKAGLARIDLSGSGSFDNVVTVYRQQAGGGLSFFGCTSFSSQLSVQLDAGQTYYVQAGDVFGDGGTVRLNFQVVPPPPNDNWTDAAAISSIPFSGSADTTAATTESGEPVPACGFGQSPGTIWFAFTPSASGSYSATAVSGPFSAQVAVYSGSELGNLTQLGCRAFGQLLTFRAEAGTTYYLQLGGVFSRGVLQLRLDVAPDPVAAFSLAPGDPSGFDNVQFFDASSDPGQVGMEAWSWDFGDGATSTLQHPTHRFAGDGTYVVALEITTTDGRTASTTRTIEVKTHDVAITSFDAPQRGRVGRTSQLTVGVGNHRYPERVNVELLKSTPQGFELVGTLTQSVPVRPGRRTTPFAFSYTFTDEDLAMGKVTFRSRATIVGARDALAGDNDAVSLPVKVNG